MFPQRILILLPSLVMGGADKFNLDAVKQLVARGYAVTICTTLPSDNVWASYFEEVVTDILHLYPPLSPLIQGGHKGGEINPSQYLLDLIAARQIDLIFVSHTYIGYAMLPLIRYHYPQVVCVDYCHLEEASWRHGGHPRFSVGYQDWLDLQLVTSQYLKNWLVARGGQAERIEVCYINVDVETWQPQHFDRETLRREITDSAESCLILYAARLVPQKRPLLCAEIIRQLVVKSPHYICVVAGDGPELPALQEFVQTHQLTYHVCFMGAVSPNRMAELYAAADIFLLPSAHEGIALAIYEAMAMETVPVAAAVGGQAELVTPECGYLITPGPHEVTEYVTVLTQLVESPTLRLRLAQAARQRVTSHFRLEQMGQRLVDLFQQAARQRKMPPVLSESVARDLAQQGWEYAELAQHAQQQASTISDFHARIDTLWQENQRLFAANQQAWDAIKQLSTEKDHLWDELQAVSQQRDHLITELRQHWLSRVSRKIAQFINKLR